MPADSSRPDRAIQPQGPFGRSLSLLAERFDDRHGCLPSLLLALVLSSALACASPEVSAHWRQREITIDGALADWQGWQMPLPGVDARLAVANDESALYLSLATADPELLRHLARQGLTVWFDPSGGNEERLGVRLPPAGLRDSGRRPGGLELLGPKPDQRRWLSGAEAEASGFRSAVAQEASLVYELRLPLAGTEGWSLKAGGGGRLGIGVALPVAAGDRSWTAGGGGQIEGGGLGDGPPRENPGAPPVTPGVNGPTSGGIDGPGGPRGSARTNALRVPEADLSSQEVWAVVRLATPGGR